MMFCRKVIEFVERMVILIKDKIRNVFGFLLALISAFCFSFAFDIAFQTILKKLLLQYSIYPIIVWSLMGTISYYIAKRIVISCKVISRTFSFLGAIIFFCGLLRWYSFFIGAILIAIGGLIVYFNDPYYGVNINSK